MKTFTHKALAALLAVCLLMPGFAYGETDIAMDLSGEFMAVPEGEAADEWAYEEPVLPDMNSAELVVGYVAAAESMISPLTCTEFNLVSMNQLMFESVVDLDENMKPSPMLADSWVQNGKTWTFKLRSGIRFHNGYDLSSYDVVRSYEMIMQAGATNPYYKRLNQLISGMEATDTLTLTVQAKYTGMITLYAMTFPVMQNTTILDIMPRGTGPYWFIQYDSDGTVRMEANPLWWKQQPSIKSIIFKQYYTPGDVLEAIQTNQIDMLSSKSPKAALSRKLGNLTSMDYATLTYEMLIPNLNEMSIMSDVNVRRAVMYAIDRSVIASNAYGDMAIQCEVPLPPSSWLYESQSARYYYSPERAMQLMNESGWRDLTGNGILNKLEGIMLKEPTITILTYNEKTSSIRENAANMIAEYLETIGFNVTVSVVSASRAKNRIENRDYDLALIGVNLSEVPILNSVLHSDGNLNFNRYNNEQMDALLSSVGGATSETQLKQIYSDIQMTVVDRLPIMGLLFRTGTVLSTRSMAGMSGMRAYDTFNGLEFVQ